MEPDYPPAAAFGRTLRSVRGQAGLSQCDFANRLGTTQRHLSFLETGRARPSLSMIQRVEREFALPIASRLALYEAAGLHSPYKRRDLASEEISEALDIIEHRLLRHWPFPAYVVDKRWTILRSNTAGQRFLSATCPPGNEPPNLFRILTGDDFRSRVTNWKEAAPVLATRLYREAAEDPEMAALLEEALAAGLFDGIDANETSDTTIEIPVFVPIEFSAPDGVKLRLTSMLGQLASVQDAIIEGMTIELMVPMDEASEQLMLASFADQPALERTA
ncbi:helix-turn-helix domain-containing protein [Labrenzia sp. CE80]|uniref:helix-turn-helix domain-containing protein n=1 Tax=Labrenzia sp. CE80 TaxID=1788986 RepID=UPI0025700AB5|nr:helix-turn-helix domain-containing protein [Labrenzia sp. CE80]